MSSGQRVVPRKKLVGGFTLVELIVSIGIFTIILFIVTSALFTVVHSDRKSRTVRIATDNLNLAIEDMTRKIKTGTRYYCTTGGAADIGVDGVGNCPSGGDTLYFRRQDGTRMGYTLSRGAIYRNMGAGSVQVTSPEISITGLKFIVSGSALGLSQGGTDKTQPMVVITIDGSLGTNVPIKIQTTVTQRSYDI